MKQVFAIFFAIYFLVGGFLPKMDFSQLIYFGEAIEHFRCHQSHDLDQGKLYSVLDFVLSHFIYPDDHMHLDDHSHDELPLQQFNHGLQFVISTLSATLTWQDQNAEQVRRIAFVDKFYGCDYFRRIEHPPSATSPLGLIS